jgi:hypothetical protein
MTPCKAYNVESLFRWYRKSMFDILEGKYLRVEGEYSGEFILRKNLEICLFAMSL